MSIFSKPRPKTAFVCRKCKEVYIGTPFDKWAGGGIVITENARDLCLHCVGRIAIEEGNHMLRQENQEAGR